MIHTVVWLSSFSVLEVSLGELDLRMARAGMERCPGPRLGTEPAPRFVRTQLVSVPKGRFLSV